MIGKIHTGRWITEDRYNAYFDIADWCPLTGPLPLNHEFSPTSQEERCLQVILAARELAEFEGGYSESFLKTARTIDQLYDSIDQQLRDNDYMVNGVKKAAAFARGFTGRLYWDYDVSDYFIWAVLAICKAFRALECILMDHAGRESLLIEEVQDAQELIGIAHEAREYDRAFLPTFKKVQKLETDIEEYAEELERTQSEAKTLRNEREARRERNKRNAKTGSQTVKKKADLRRDDWQRAANKYWEQKTHRRASKSEAAGWVASEISKRRSDFSNESDTLPTFKSLKQQIERSIQNPFLKPHSKNSM